MDDTPRRKSLRLKGFDYSLHHTWHVVIHIHPTAERFGEITADGIRLSRSGELVDRLWREMPAHYLCVVTDCHAIMPDHVHLLLGITEPHLVDPATAQSRLSLPQVMQRYKSFTTKVYRDLVGGSGDTHLWQRSYWDEAIRSERQLSAARHYVVNNARQAWLDEQDGRAQGPAPSKLS